MASLRVGPRLTRCLTRSPATPRILPLSAIACHNTPIRRTVHTAQPARQTRTQLPNDNAPKIISNASPDAKEGKSSSTKINRFDLTEKVFVVTGGARGLGLSMAAGLIEAGGTGELTHTCAGASPNTTQSTASTSSQNPQTHSMKPNPASTPRTAAP